MEREFVPYNESLELKELGFDEPCFGKYKKGHDGDVILNVFLEPRNEGNELDIYHGQSAFVPLFQQAFRWFREKHGLFVSVNVDQTTKPKFYYNVSEYYEDETTWEWKDGWGNSFMYKTHEEAELACLRKMIEVVKKEKQA